MGYIYVLTNKVNGKKYIGQSKQADIKNRWRSYTNLSNSSVGIVLLRALKKHGVDNFKFQIICICFDDDCNQYEKDYIKKYNTILPNGYNMQEGGKNPDTATRKKFVWTAEAREARKGRFAGEKSAVFGKPLGAEHKRKLSEALKTFAKNNKNIKPREQKACPQRVVEKLDENHLLVGTYDSLTAAAKTINTSPTLILRYAQEGRLYRGFYWKIVSETKRDGIPFGLLAKIEAAKKKVIQYDHENNFIASYESISEAARCINGCIQTISRCASGDPTHKRNKTHKGFIWRFEQIAEEPPKKKQTKASRAYKSFLRNPDGTIATLS